MAQQPFDVVISDMRMPDLADQFLDARILQAAMETRNETQNVPQGFEIKRLRNPLVCNANALLDRLFVSVT